MADDPYETLGVARDATPSDIRRAYHQLAKRFHPDKNRGDKAAEERFKAASAANDLLSDPAQRTRFDQGIIDADGQERPQPRPRRRPAAAGNRTAWNIEDIDALFGGRDRAPADQRGRDETYRLAVGFLDAVNGATSRITLPDGRTIDVRVPVGVQDGQTLRLRGQGGAGLGSGGAGDALVELVIAPHAFFRRAGQDVRLDVPVSLAEAVLGGRITVPTPRGAVEMAVPPRSDTGRELRLRGRGIAEHDGLPAGDFYVTLVVTIGTPDAALEEFLRGWQPETVSDPRQALLQGG